MIKLLFELPLKQTNKKHRHLSVSIQGYHLTTHVLGSPSAKRSSIWRGFGVPTNDSTLRQGGPPTIVISGGITHIGRK